MKDEDESDESDYWPNLPGLKRLIRWGWQEKMPEETTIQAAARFYLALILVASYYLFISCLIIGIVAIMGRLFAVTHDCFGTVAAFAFLGMVWAVAIVVLFAVARPGVLKRLRHVRIVLDGEPIVPNNAIDKEQTP